LLAVRGQLHHARLSGLASGGCDCPAPSGAAAGQDLHLLLFRLLPDHPADPGTCRKARASAREHFGERSGAVRGKILSVRGHKTMSIKKTFLGVLAAAAIAFGLAPAQAADEFPHTDQQSWSFAGVF